ncbi:MAG: efflux RND transporter periplasmic adaptor subunit [Lentisphaeria bacterium]|jgi:multidrug efflux pump subunit AcrA (membrane-fusion protein)
MNQLLTWIWHRRWRTLALLAAAAALGGWGWHRRQQAAEPAEMPERATVIRTDITLRVTCNGKAVANQDVEVKCKAGGQIVKLPFDISDPVKAGDVLLQIDPVDEQRVVRQMEVKLAISSAKLLAARQNLAIAERNLETDRNRAGATLKAAEARHQDAAAKAERMRQLLAKALCSEEECDSATATAASAAADLENARIRLAELETAALEIENRRQEVVQAQAQVATDEIQLTVAQDRLRDTTVAAPIAGVVATREVQVGQIIASATSNVGGGTLLLTISDLSRMFILAAVDESLIGRVKVGQKAIVTADAYPGKLFEGTVERIATRGTVTANVVTYEVKIEVTSPAKGLLKPEMSANVEILTEAKSGVLAVPVAAVRRQPAGYVAHRVDKGNGRVREVPVNLGLNDGTQVEILAGLAEGDTVELQKAGDGKWGGQPASRGAQPRPPMMMGLGRGRR